MYSLHVFLVLALCLLQALDSSDAFHKRGMVKRLQKNRGPKRKTFPKGTDGYYWQRTMNFNDGSINGGTEEGSEFENVALYCKVTGVPAPSIHWLKDGKRITQKPGSCQDTDDNEEELNGLHVVKLSAYTSTSTLYIDCLDETDQANYTCVAQSPTNRITRSVFLTVEKEENPTVPVLKACARKGRPARIYMETNSVLELENNNVRFSCRAQGNPPPTITWFDRDNKTIQDGGNYRISKNGDLIIRNITWFDHMGVYTCEAKNAYGTDISNPFVYPTARE